MYAVPFRRVVLSGRSASERARGGHISRESCEDPWNPCAQILCGVVSLKELPAASNGLAQLLNGSHDNEFAMRKPLSKRSSRKFRDCGDKEGVTKAEIPPAETVV